MALDKNIQIYTQKLNVDNLNYQDFSVVMARMTLVF